MGSAGNGNFHAQNAIVIFGIRLAQVVAIGQVDVKTKVAKMDFHDDELASGRAVPKKQMCMYEYVPCMHFQYNVSSESLG